MSIVLINLMNFSRIKKKNKFTFFVIIRKHLDLLNLFHFRKNRVVKEIKLKELHELRNDYERTEQNMLILRHPYLTVEQAHGHVKQSGVDTEYEFWKNINNKRKEKFEKHITMAERLVHLKVKEAWD